MQQFALAGGRGEFDEFEAVDAERILESGDLHAQVRAGRGLGVHAETPVNVGRTIARNRGQG
ncbi:hypothetical protein GCM10027431_00600 [Lysobacter rhizosphaerae]